MFTNKQRCFMTVPITLYLLVRFLPKTIQTVSKDRIRQQSSFESIDNNTQSTTIMNIVGSNISTANESRPRYITNQQMLVNCSSIQNVDIKGMLGKGISKQGYTGEYGGQSFVVKVNKRDATEISTCLANFEKVPNIQKVCYQYPRSKMMYEILLLHELSHPNIARLLGYCARGEDWSSINTKDHGLITVVEFGERLSKRVVKKEHWTTQLSYALDLAKLLVYFQHSPLGSILHRDYKAAHFKIFDDTLKMIDLDMIHNKEANCVHQPCEFELKCQSGQCSGYNARRNIWKLQVTFADILFRHTNYPANIAPDIRKLNQSLVDFDINADELLQTLREIENKGL